jgi:hypothetical protein
MGTFWDYLGIGSSEADKSHETAAKALELNSRNIDSLAQSLGVDRQYFDRIANKDEREQALADVEALANRQEKRVKRGLVNTGNSAMAQMEAAKAAANTRDETYAGALQQSRSRKDAAKEKSIALKQQQVQLGSQAAQAQVQAAQERAQKMTDGQRVNALVDRGMQMGMTAASIYGAGQNAGWWGGDKTAGTTDTTTTATTAGTQTATITAGNGGSGNLYSDKRLKNVKLLQ